MPSTHHDPAGHISHGPPCSPKKPGMQMQFDRLPDPEGEWECEGHAAQVAGSDEARIGEYVPALQEEQGEEPGGVL